MRSRLRRAALAALGCAAAVLAIWSFWIESFWTESFWTESFWTESFWTENGAASAHHAMPSPPSRSAGHEKADAASGVAQAARHDPYGDTDGAERLRLTGVLATNNPREGFAFIATDAEGTRSYAVSDRLDRGSAQLREIHSDRVILDRDGRQETLFLSTPPGGASSSAPPSSSDSSPSQDFLPHDALAARAPERPLDGIQLLRQTRRVDRHGRLHGLAIRDDLTTYTFTRRSDLRPGDIILAVNGVSASAIRNRRVDAEVLLANERMELVLDRAGEVKTIAVDLRR